MRLIPILIVIVLGQRWADRLEALEPARPLAYFELAEEIADAAPDATDRALARHLFALAGVIDPMRLGRSACLALADMAEQPRIRRRLRALALLLGEREGESAAIDPAAWPEDPLPTPSTLEALCTSFSYYRRGEGPRAQRALREPGAMSLLESLDRHLEGGVARYLEDCRLYRGGHKQPVAGADVDGMLHLEAALLAQDQRTFSEDLLLHDGRPLVEVDPDRLAQTLGVDASRPYYRSGRWGSGP